jgi:hypothetical protein
MKRPVSISAAILLISSGAAFAQQPDPLTRMIAAASDGTVYAIQRTPGNLVMLRDPDRDGVVDAQKGVLSVKDLHGIAIHGNRLFLADVTHVYSTFIRQDGRLGVGSTCNECIEPNTIGTFAKES